MNKNNLPKYLRRYDFEKCYQLMNSSHSRTKIVGLQKLEELLRDGNKLVPADSKKLEAYLLDFLHEDGIGIEEKDAVRRCAYRLCARLHNPKIRNTCLELLTQEINPDNKMSIIPILSQSAFSDKGDNYILGLDSGLSYEQITLAQYAYPGFSGSQLERKFIYNLLDANDTTALRFLPIIFNAQPRHSNYRNKLLNSELFGELANHDDPWVQKYALGTFQKMNKFHIEDLNIDPSNFLTLDSQPQKWVMTSMFLDSQFIKKNQDLVGVILSEHHLLEECDDRVKEGIAQGLLRYGYSANLAQFVIPWYSLESEESVKVLLRSYMKRARKRNKEFDYVLSEEEKLGYTFNTDAGLYLPDNTKYGISKLTFNFPNKLAEQTQNKLKGKMFMFNVIGQNSGNIVIGGVTNSTLSIEKNTSKLEQEIDSKGGADTEELKALLSEVKELMDNIETSRTIPKQKTLFKKLSEHMTTHGWFYAEVVALLGQQAINMLGS